MASKLGKNPFEKKGKSQVGRMIEASFATSIEPEKKIQDRGLLERLQEMKVSLDFKEIFKSAKDRSN